MARRGERHIPKLGHPLSRKQVSIMVQIIDEGKSRTEISEFTGMAPSTVTMHLWRIKQKLGASTLAQAAVFFDRKRWEDQ